MKTIMDVCREVQEGKVTIEEAAQRFGINKRAIQARLAAWGDKLELLSETLELIKSDRITREEAARRLGTGVRNVNGLMERWQVERPIGERTVQRTLSEVKWEIRKKAALDYIRGNANITVAATEAGVSERQIRRWVSELLQKHLEMTWGELQTMPMSKRFRVANEIEKSEGLALATKKVVEAITSGNKTIEEEVKERLATRVRRKFPDASGN